MHMRHQADQFDVVLRGPTGLHFVVRIARRDAKRRVVGAIGNGSQRGGLFGKAQADIRAVLYGMAVRRVVGLEKED